MDGVKTRRQRAQRRARRTERVAGVWTAGTPLRTWRTSPAIRPRTLSFSGATWRRSGLDSPGMAKPCGVAGTNPNSLVVLDVADQQHQVVAKLRGEIEGLEHEGAADALAGAVLRDRERTQQQRLVAGFADQDRPVSDGAHELRRLPARSSKGPGRARRPLGTGRRLCGTCRAEHVVVQAFDGAGQRGRFRFESVLWMQKLQDCVVRHDTLSRRIAGAGAGNAQEIGRRS